ncbi:hypothetical protein TNCV_1205871 [Trichonephila clavipes]|nr:hypothetical protein TNCV_1205871 [Trichonephila clavipes]
MIFRKLVLQHRLLRQSGGVKEKSCQELPCAWSWKCGWVRRPLRASKRVYLLTRMADFGEITKWRKGLTEGRREGLVGGVPRDTDRNLIHRKKRGSISRVDDEGEVGEDVLNRLAKMTEMPLI